MLHHTIQKIFRFWFLLQDSSNVDCHRPVQTNEMCFQFRMCKKHSIPSAFQGMDQILEHLCSHHRNPFLHHCIRWYIYLHDHTHHWLWPAAHYGHSLHHYNLHKIVGFWLFRTHKTSIDCHLVVQTEQIHFHIGKQHSIPSAFQGMDQILEH